MGAGALLCVVASLDDLIFGQNSAGSTADGHGVPRRFTGCRLDPGHRQPLPGARNFRAASGFTIGTKHHIAEHFDLLPVRHWSVATAIDNNNLSLISSDICDRTAQVLKLNYTK